MNNYATLRTQSLMVAALRNISIPTLLLCAGCFSAQTAANDWQVAKSKSASYKFVGGEHQVKFFLKVTNGTVPKGELIGIHVNRQQEHPNYWFKQNNFVGYRVIYSGGKRVYHQQNIQLPARVASKFQPLKRNIVLPGRHEFYIEMMSVQRNTEVEVEIRFKGSWKYLCSVRAELPGFNSSVTVKRCKNISWNGIAPDPEPVSR